MRLPIDTFRAQLGYHPFHFWQLVNADIPLNSKCNALVFEYNWQQADASGRKNIRDSIGDAHQTLLDYLKFRIGTEYTDATVEYPKTDDPRMERYCNIDPRGRRIPVALPEGEIQEIGIEQNLIIDDAAAVVYSDRDLDSIDDTFTLTVDITGVDVTEDQIAVYFSAADRLDGDPIGERWRIAPIYVTIAGNIATITGRSWLLVCPILYEGVTRRHIDPNDNGVAGSFAQELEVYKLSTYKDGTTVDDCQAVLIWESAPYPCWATPCNNLTFATGQTDPNAEAYAVARCGIRDKRTGYVTPGEAVYNTDGTWSEVVWSGVRSPDKVLVRYLAGVEITRPDEIMITRLTAALMARPICACDTANQELYRWQFDLSRATGKDAEQYQISSEDLNNPLGLTARGAVYAWKQIKNKRFVRAHLP